MVNSANIIISLGIILFTFSLINSFYITGLQENFQRSEVLASLSSIIIITIGIAFQKVKPKLPIKASFKENEGLHIDNKISNSAQSELAWGSKTLLKATPSATILIYWKDKVLLKRGYISDEEFKPGNISKSSMKKNKMISLPNTKNYPGSNEFESIVKGIPSILITPIGKDGFLFLGGWTARCFSKSDEILAKCWSEKLSFILSIETTEDLN